MNLNRDIVIWSGCRPLYKLGSGIGMLLLFPGGGLDDYPLLSKSQFCVLFHVSLMVSSRVG